MGKRAKRAKKRGQKGARKGEKIPLDKPISQEYFEVVGCSILIDRY